MSFVRKLFFSITLFTFVIPGFVSAQTSNNLDYNKIPEIAVGNVYFEKDSYSSEEEVVGTVTLKNKRDFDTSDVYLVVSLLGSNDQKTELSKYTAFDFSNQIGPYFVKANDETVVPFRYQLPGYKPTEYSGLRVRAVLADGNRLGRAEKVFAFQADILTNLILSNQNIKAGTSVFSLQQVPTIYEKEQAQLSYSVSSDGNEEIRVTPVVTIREKRDLTKVVAKYADPLLVVQPSSGASVITNLRNFSNNAGIYEGEINFIDGEQRERGQPVIFSYIIDGPIASIESILTNTQSVSFGQYLNVLVNYSGQPLDIRDVNRSRIIGDVDVTVTIKDLSGRVIEEENYKEDLEADGQLDLELKPRYGANGFSVDVTFSKDGEVLDTKSIDVPATAQKSYGLIITVISIILLIVVIAVYLLIRKIRHKIPMVSLILALLSAGLFVHQAEAYTVVYTAGNSNYIPNSLSVVDNTDTTPVSAEAGSVTSLDVEFDAPTVYGASQDVKVYSMKTSPCYSGSCQGDIGYWEEDPPSSVLTEGVCDENSCDQNNWDYWSGGEEFVYGTGCSSGSSCWVDTTQNFSTDGTEGTFRAYFYIRNENIISSCDENSVCTETTEYGIMLAYEDIDVTNYYPIGDNEAPSCYAENGTVANFDESVTWAFNPGYCADTTPPPNACDYFYVNENSAYFRWTGDLGENYQGDGNTAFPQSLYDVYNDPNGYCQNTYSSSDYYFSGGQCCHSYEDYQCQQVETFCDEFECYYEEQCTPVTVEECSAAPDPSAWGTSLTTSYPSNTVDPENINVTLEYYDSYNDNSYQCGPNHNEYCNWENDSHWETINCRPIEVSESDICANIDGVQLNPPTGFHVYPDPSEVGQNGVTYGDLVCYPVVLAQQGSISLAGSPSLSPLYGTVDWAYTLSADYFQGIYEGVTYQIPRYGTTTWTGDVNNGSYISGNSGTIEDVGLITLSSDSISTNYTQAGSAGVSISIKDPYLTLSDTDYVTVQDEFGCPGDPSCVETGPASIDSLVINPNIVNQGESCYLAWTTSEYTTTCTLITSLGDISVTTSSEGYAVDPGQYTLTCQNDDEEAEVITAGPVSCILNPDVKDQ